MRRARARLRNRRNPSKHVTSVPRMVKIGKHWWKIFVEPETSFARISTTGGRLLENEPGGGLYGLCETRPREIHLSRLVAKRGRLRDEILVHELLHAMLEDEPMFLMKANPIAAEERFVRRLVPKLLQVMRQLKWGMPTGRVTKVSR